MALLDEFKEYLVIDGDDHDTTLTSLLSAAKATLEYAGVAFPSDVTALNDNNEKKYPLHFLAVVALAAHYFENKQVTSSQAQNAIPFGVQHMILQLKLVNIDESIEI